MLLPADRLLVHATRRTPIAGKKAFIVNRIGDFGFLVGASLLFWALQRHGRPATVDFHEIRAVGAAARPDTDLSACHLPTLS